MTREDEMIEAYSAEANSAAGVSCAAAAGYVAALENALAAAIVSLYTTDREDMLAEFTFDEIAGCVARTRKMQALKLEHIYSLALRYPRPHTVKTVATEGAGESPTEAAQPSNQK